MTTIITRKRKKEQQEAMSSRENLHTIDSTNNEVKRHRKPVYRQVEFDDQPLIHEITPLDDKQIGIVRMPEAPKPVQEDMESPKNEEVVVLSEDDNRDRKDSRQYLSNDGHHAYNRRKLKKLLVQEDMESPNQMVPRFAIQEYMESLEDDKMMVNSEDGPDRKYLREYLSSDEHHAYERGRSKKEAIVEAQLPWNQLFTPQTIADFFGKSRSDFQELSNWLDQWKKRLSWLKKSQLREQRNNKKKRRLSSGFESEEEEDDDIEYWPASETLNNPMVLEGPTGCGKTTMVYAAAKAMGFHVLEIPSSSLRDGQTLRQKLSGAVESHNVNNNNQRNLDIRSMLTQSPNPQQRKQTEDFSLILIDECDNIFASDHNFWPVLKTFCADSRIPIVLTCNDYTQVGNGLNCGEPCIDNYKTIHMDRPATNTFAHYLRAWILGFTARCVKIGSLYNLIDAHNRDPRAVLNALQLESCQQLGNKWGRYETETEYDKRLAISLKEQRKRNLIRVELDAASRLGERIGMLATSFDDLDLVECPHLINGNSKAQLDDRKEHYANYLEAFGIESELASTSSSNRNFKYVEPMSVIRTACIRSTGRRYSVAETSQDYLPCLLSIHQRYLRDSKAHSSQRAPPHPFDLVDGNTGEQIDRTNCLKLDINNFLFP